jgi:hypothetical protein
LKSRCLQAILCKLSWIATVYHIWRLRNDISLGSVPKSEEKLLQLISGRSACALVVRVSLRGMF